MCIKVALDPDFPTSLHHCLSLSLPSSSSSISIFFDFSIIIYAYEMTISRHTQWHDMFSFQPSFIVSRRRLWIKSEETCENKNARDSRDKGRVKETESEKKWAREVATMRLHFDFSTLLARFVAFVSFHILAFHSWESTICLHNQCIRSQSVTHRFLCSSRVWDGCIFFRKKNWFLVSCFASSSSMQQPHKWQRDTTVVEILFRCFFLSLFICLFVKHSKIGSKISAAQSL